MAQLRTVREVRHGEPRVAVWVESPAKRSPFLYRSCRYCTIRGLELSQGARMIRAGRGFSSAPARSSERASSNRATRVLWECRVCGGRARGVRDRYAAESHRAG